ncbi:unnamed protein product [Microthlaspi erraticum]|uniref:Uncharacterized protein n=1 Tax=Microthlaspi erraticum TaxID=1685480 RepID=A0A6D2KAJ6_9BRAS|nr:unnamed protein product [Microthlaspi erraticum]
MAEPESRGPGTRIRNPIAAESVLRYRREKRNPKRKLYGLDDDFDAVNDPYHLMKNHRLSFEFDVEFYLPPYTLVESEWGDSYDIALYSRLGLHCHNIQKGTNFKFVRWEKYRSAYTAYMDYYVTLEAKDTSSDSDISFQTLLRNVPYSNKIIKWMILASRIKCNKAVDDDEWDDTGVDGFYKGPMRKWLSDEDLARDNKKYYVVRSRPLRENTISGQVKESELQENDWLHLFTEIAFYGKTKRTAEAYTPLEMKKVVIETKEGDTTEALKAGNAIYYVSYKCIDDDPSTGWPGDHKAIIRKTMDGKPEHMYLEVTDGTREEEEEE